jgi:N utilization substance protein B
MQALYAYELSNSPIERVIDETMTELKKDDHSFTFAKELVMTVLNKEAEIDVLICQRVPNWEFNRIAVIDRLLLRMAICEFLFFPDIPPKVTINEAIEIAKRYSTEKSDKFINGVLDTALEDLKESGRIQKTGRGLVDVKKKSRKFDGRT